MQGTTIIFGGTGGIGSAIARRVRQRGDRVHLVARDEGRLRKLADEIGASHAVADVMDRGAIEGAVAAAGESISGLAYAVGTIDLKPISRLSDEDFEQDFRINALGAARAVRAALPGLKKVGDGSVVFFSTVAVAQGFGSHASIAMAKGAVEGLTVALAAELAPKIKVNCIAPSLTKTPMAAAAKLTTAEPMTSAIAALHALERLGEPDDIAALAAFLLSAEASWITGQIIGVDGGRSTLRTKG
jgi:NAD(P)-dependent dehydrogenase (short-subunit alcohol dehydrogenase family)